MTASVRLPMARRPRTASALWPASFVAAASLFAVGCNNITVSGSPNPVPVGQPVTFTATIAGSGPIPSGTVVFKDNTVPISGAVPVLPGTGSTGVASFMTSSLLPGMHPIAASYSGDMNYQAQDSPPIAETVLGPPTSFYGLASPCRLFDTRQPAGPYGGPALAPGADRTLVAAGHCGVPSGAASIAVNVAVTQGSGVGNLILFPAGTAAPNASTINYGAGRTRANNAVVALGTNGDFTVRTSQPAGSVDVIVDVAGYFQ
jgi:hypothetical protein